ncbi:hypothetical protein ACHMW6_05570 [Pseudoduganella sp. UC29_106]|uniref:hypothetical protein n=1 Tax=Pseudoduganella sp. UC29_106 TaxID=3374553 RepID=UPI003757EDDD
MKKLMTFIFAFGAAMSFAYAADLGECQAFCQAENIECLKVQGPGACSRAYDICMHDCMVP